MNYEAERAMNQKRLRMEGEPGHGVVQGNGLPLNYIEPLPWTTTHHDNLDKEKLYKYNGHQIPYQPYAGYNPHYGAGEPFAAYGPASAYAQYAPPAHQNYPHHQPFPQQQMHMPQSHMVQGYGDVGVHKGAWPPQPHLLAPLDAQKPLDVKQLKPEIKLEPTDAQKRPHPEEMMGGDLDQPKIKIKTDIFKPDDLAHRPGLDKPLDVAQKALDVSQKPTDLQGKDDAQGIGAEKAGDKPAEASKPEGASEGGTGLQSSTEPMKPPEKSDVERKPFSSPDLPTSGTMPGKVSTPGTEPKKRGRPKGSTNKPKPLVPNKLTATVPGGAPPRGPPPRPALPPGRPRATGYQYAVRPFRKDFSGIQFRRRWSDECLDSSHIPNEVYFGDVPVSMEVLFNYYDANAERERLAAQAAHIAAQKAAAAKLHAARLQASGRLPAPAEVTTVDSSSSDDTSGSSGSDTDDSDDGNDTPLKRGPGRPKGSKNSPRPVGAPSTPGKRGRPPVPPELRAPGITEMKKFCKAAGIRFDYKKLVDGCTKNKERVQKMMDLLTDAGLEGKPTLEKCQAIKQAKLEKKEAEKQAKMEAKAKHKEEDGGEQGSSRRMTRGATGVKPRQRIVISSDEEDDTPAARRTLSKLRSSVNDTDSD